MTMQATMTLLVSALALGGADPQKLKITSNGDLRHPSTVRAIAVTPDSRTAFVGLNDGALLAYTIETRQAVQVGPRRYGTLFDLALSPRGDRLATVDGDGYVALFDSATFDVLSRVQVKGEPEHVVFRPDGSALYVATSYGRLLMLDASNLSALHDIFPTQGSRVIALACSRDGRTVATSDREGQIKLWSSDDLKLQKTWKAHKIFARSLAFDPSGNRLVSGGQDGMLKVWSVPDYTLLAESKDYHQESIECIAHTRDGRMVTGGYDGLCQFWDASSFKAGKSYPNYRGYIRACAATPDGRWLIRGGTSLDFVPLDQPENFVRVADFGGSVMGLAVTRDRKRIVSGGLDRRLIQWQVAKGITSQTAVLEDWLTALDYCRDDAAIAAGLANGKIAIHAADTLQAEQAWQAHKGRVAGLAAVGEALVSIGDDGRVNVWASNGTKLRSFDAEGPCRSIAARKNLCAVGTAHGTIAIYDIERGVLVKQLRGRPMSVTALSFSGGGSRLTVGYFDGALESLETDAWSVVESRPGRGASILSLDSHPSSDWLAVGDRDGQARILNVASLRDAGAVSLRPAREVYGIRWALNDNTFVAAGAGNAVAFYRMQPATVNEASLEVLDIDDQLSSANARDAVRTDSYRRVFNLRLEKGETYVIDMMSRQIDSYLRLEDAAGTQLDQDDDGGEGLNARIVFTPPASGTYRVIATTFVGGATGGYRLRVTQR
jgi:WD40 repeat protein